MTSVLEQQGCRNGPPDNSEDTIVSRFGLHVAAVPDQLALVTDEVSLTYRALDLMASRIATVLRSLPSPRERPIMLFMKGEAARVAAMLGALKANRIFIPVASNAPEKWLARVIEDSETAHIIADSATQSIAELVATGSVTVMDVEQLARSLEPFVADRTVSPDDTAYVVYTSGSTGRPKGVASSHRSLVRNCDSRNLVAGIRDAQRYANLRSSGVYSWIRNSFSALLSGGCLLPFDLHRHGLHRLAPWLIAQEITYVSLSSSLLRTWLASLPDTLRFPALRCVWATGEALYSQDVIRVARHLVGDWRIGHSYSSTETGLIAAQVFTPSRLPDPGVVAVGHPVDGLETCLKDETGADVRLGETGEIIVRGRFLAQGYWNNPELTAKVFQTDPLDSTIRIYRTGDLGRWRSDGTLEHLGRMGRRIRLRGYSVEPFEVECALMRQPGVTDAVVVLHEGSAGEEPCLVGYVVAPTSASASIIRQSLAAHLPSYLVPSHIVVLDSLPVASSGKIDRTALPPPQREKARTVAFRAPTNDRERELCAIWQEVLKIPKIGIDDDFFELGGTSLQVFTVFARIAARLECSLSPTTIVQAQTIARLAEFIRPITGTVGSQSLVLLHASGMGPPLFLVKPGYYGVMHYRHLLKDLSRDRPVFGLQPLPLDGKHHVPRTIESMAADYVAEIRGVQPHGPYFLAGYSFGGRVSFEIAQQLVRAGERVSFLGMIDTTFRDQSVEGRSWVPEVVKLSHKVRRVHSLQNLLHRGLGFIWRKMRYLLWAIWIRLLDLWFRIGRSIPYEQRPVYYDWISTRANQSYVIKPYPGHITMFSSAGNSERQQALWGTVAGGGLTVLEVPAGHDHMASPPHSKLLAEYFNACLDANCARPSSPTT